MKYAKETRYIAESTLAARGRSGGMKPTHDRIKTWKRVGDRMMAEIWIEAHRPMKLAPETAAVRPPKKRVGVKKWAGRRRQVQGTDGSMSPKRKGLLTASGSGHATSVGG